MSSAEMSTKTTDMPSSGLPELAAAAAAASGRCGGLLPNWSSSPHVPAQAPAAAGEAADTGEPAALAAPAVDAAAFVTVQCRHDAALAKYKAAAAEYKAKIGTGEDTAFKELKDEAYAILQSANEHLVLTLRSIPGAAMSSSRKLESHEGTIAAGVRKRQKKLGTLRCCLISG